MSKDAISSSGNEILRAGSEGLSFPTLNAGLFRQSDLKNTGKHGQEMNCQHRRKNLSALDTSLRLGFPTQLVRLGRWFSGCIDGPPDFNFLHLKFSGKVFVPRESTCSPGFGDSLPKCLISVGRPPALALASSF